MQLGAPRRARLALLLHLPTASPVLPGMAWRRQGLWPRAFGDARSWAHCLGWRLEAADSSSLWIWEAPRDSWLQLTRVPPSGSSAAFSQGSLNARLWCSAQVSVGVTADPASSAGRPRAASSPRTDAQIQATQRWLISYRGTRQTHDHRPGRGPPRGPLWCGRDDGDPAPRSAGPGRAILAAPAHSSGRPAGRGPLTLDACGTSALSRESGGARARAGCGLCRSLN